MILSLPFPSQQRHPPSSTMPCPLDPRMSIMNRVCPCINTRVPSPIESPLRSHMESLPSCPSTRSIPGRWCTQHKPSVGTSQPAPQMGLSQRRPQTRKRRTCIWNGEDCCLINRGTLPPPDAARPSKLLLQKLTLADALEVL
jgi:hypothetical protein